MPSPAMLLAACMLLLVACGAPETRRIDTGPAATADRPPSAADLRAPIASVPKDAPRLALVIGVGDYAALPDLSNPGNDARMIASTLRGLGFALSGGAPLLNPDRARLRAAVAAYRAELAASEGIGLVYYAGHAVQIEGRNWLAPADAAPRDLADIATELMPLETILGTERQSAMNLVILDACRNSPFDDAAGRGAALPDPALRSVSAGLSRLVAPPNTLVAFATSPGDVALDGAFGNSPYALALAAALSEPGLRIEDVFIKVRQIVEATTRGRQTPWETSSLTGRAILNTAGLPDEAELIPMETEGGPFGGRF